MVDDPQPPVHDNSPSINIVPIAQKHGPALHIIGLLSSARHRATAKRVSGLSNEETGQYPLTVKWSGSLDGECVEGERLDVEGKEDGGEGEHGILLDRFLWCHSPPVYTASTIAVRQISTPVYFTAHSLGVVQ